MSATITWRAWAAAAVIFILGITVGVAGTSLYGLRVLRRAIQTPPAAGGPIDRATARIAEDLVRSLQLPPPEAQRVRAEFAQTAANIRALRTQSNRQMIAELRQGARRVAAELPPQQRAAFYNRLERRLQAIGFDGSRLRAEDPDATVPNPVPAKREP
ncbi:MAG TPA: hypothetical protein VGD88_03640 [Opitutaceae bacterium]